MGLTGIDSGDVRNHIGDMVDAGEILEDIQKEVAECFGEQDKEWIEEIYLDLVYRCMK